MHVVGQILKCIEDDLRVHFYMPTNSTNLQVVFGVGNAFTNIGNQNNGWMGQWHFHVSREENK